jgi:hypothetical protein
MVKNSTKNMKAKLLILAIFAIYLLALFFNRGEFLFKREICIDLPKGAKLIFSKKDKTERAYIWKFKGDIRHFEIPDNLKYENNIKKWEKPTFGYFGELDSKEYGENMKFKTIRTSTAYFIVGKDIVEKKIAFSWINID